jgi:hypothetical protein
MKKISLIILLLSICSVHSQYLNVKINPSAYQIYGEEYIMINPKNTNEIVAGAIGYFPPLNTAMGYFYSSNGGLNWSGGPLTTTLGQPGSDPIVVVDTSGYFYYISCANWGVSGPNLDKLFCFRSTNGGANWNNGTELAQLYPQQDDMPMACVDFSGSSFGNNIYVTWSLYDKYISTNTYDSSYVMICRSTNEGASFSTPVRVSRIAGSARGNNYSPEGPDPCTGPNGEVYVCWPYAEQVFFNRSTDAGDTWLYDDILVSQQVGGWTAYNFSPVIACDLSDSPYRGNIYICFADLRTGSTDRNIWLARSTNGGFNWDSPVKVNDDPPGNDQRLPWVCVDRVTGYVWVVFYDTRGHTSGIADVYVARSTDGGAQFQNVKVSTSTSNLNYWQGDYIGISAHNNKVRPVWSKSIGSFNVEVWTAIIDTFVIGIKKLSENVPGDYHLYQNYPNPFNPVTKIKFQTPPQPSPKERGSVVKLIVYDVLGREVAVLVNEQLSPGSYEASWDGTNYPSGVYFYKLVTGGFTETKRMVLIK